MATKEELAGKYQQLVARYGEIEYQIKKLSEQNKTLEIEIDQVQKDYGLLEKEANEKK